MNSLRKNYILTHPKGAKNRKRLFSGNLPRTFIQILSFLHRHFKIKYYRKEISLPKRSSAVMNKIYKRWKLMNFSFATFIYSQNSKNS